MSALVPPRVLIADDYAMSAGVSRAIERLAEARKISGTSAFTTLPRWREDARRIRDLRGHISVGLHLNLTVEAPLGSIASLAPMGRFPVLGEVVRASLLRHLNAVEVRDEIRRQLDAFEQALGFAPDHVDGHQHVHVLPIVRGALIAELSQRYAARPPLVRDPTDALADIATKSPAKAKAVIVRALALGFRGQARGNGLPVNTGFSGFSAFDTARPFRTEMIAALDRRHETAALKIVMCHPGFPDAELARLDPVTQRRQQEYDTLMDLAPPDAVIWHPGDTRADRMVPDWSALAAGKVAA
jgi:chitin disaccharide deacetylase